MSRMRSTVHVIVLCDFCDSDYHDGWYNRSSCGWFNGLIMDHVMDGITDRPVDGFMD